MESFAVIWTYLYFLLQFNFQDVKFMEAQKQVLVVENIGQVSREVRLNSTTIVHIHYVISS